MTLSGKTIMTRRTNQQNNPCAAPQAELDKVGREQTVPFDLHVLSCALLACSATWAGLRSCDESALALIPQAAQ